MNSRSTTLRLIGLAGFASMASMRMCDSLLVALGQDFHVSTGEAAAVISAFAVAYGLLQLVYGPLAERFGKVRVIVLATAGCAVFSVLTALAPTLPLLVLARAGMGAAAAGIIPLSLAWIGDEFSYAQRQETLARLTGATVSGMMVGQWLGGLAADTVGWRAGFAALAAVFALAATLLVRGGQFVAPAASVPRAQQPDDRATQPSAFARTLGPSWRLLGRPAVRGVLAITVAEGALAFGCLAFVPSRLVSGFGFSVAAAGATMLLYGAGGLFYSQFAGRWIAALGERGLCRLGAALIALALLVLGWADQAWLGIVACPVGGVGFYMLHGTLQTRATQMVPEARATSMTLFACVLFLGQSTGVQLAARGVDLDAYGITFSIAALGLLTLGLVMASQTRALPISSPLREKP